MDVCSCTALGSELNSPRKTVASTSSADPEVGRTRRKEGKMDLQ